MPPRSADACQPVSCSTRTWGERYQGIWVRTWTWPPRQRAHLHVGPVHVVPEAVVTAGIKPVGGDKESRE